ncbi:retron adenine methylase, partial [Salmonella enterica subsp. enterica serovar Heidelberg str. 21381]
MTQATTAILPVEKSVPRTWRRPFLKWAGGKYSMLPDLYQIIPAGMRLIEPFVGGGSVFLNSDKHACFLLADVNTDLPLMRGAYFIFVRIPQYGTRYRAAAHQQSAS